MEELQVIQNKIYEIRGTKVMLDRDLAEMYGVQTKALNQAVKRNFTRFPEDFMFQLTNQETQNWKSQIVTSNTIKKRDCHTNQHSNHPRFCRHPETCIYPADRQNNRNPARNKRTERIHRRSLYRLQRHQRRHAYATGTHQPNDCRTAK